MIYDPTYPPSKPQRESVSVIIPSKDRPEKLGSVLSSIEDQTMIPDEVIVAGEGDLTNRVAQSFSRVSLVDGSGGIGAARNRAIEDASGDVLLFIDDDSIPPENWVESMVWTLQQDEVVTCGGMNYPHPRLRTGLLARGDAARLRMNQEHEGLTIGGYELSTFGASNV
ncbi:MAG: glycosyltransferase family 2 protein, partial [Halobacteriaceae archaeon]